LARNPIVPSVRVWFASVEAAGHRHLAERHLGLLSEDERQAHRRLRFEEDQASYLAAHALLRLCLAAHTGQPPEAWQFGRGPHGKPMVLEPASQRSLEFNLSHTTQVVACVVSEAGACGIDVERTKDWPELDAIAREILTDEESLGLEAVPPATRAARFADLWSLKEACLKAQGVGLLGDARGVSFSILAGRVFAKSADGPWQCHLHALEPDHRVAVAVRGAAAWPPEITRFEW
jgi:4'-phosphopantetheinyl transferase